ncbi:MAG: efflux RND transporter periplasmic adaptor subunit [Bacteroidia bacterium]|nr:efflux RND transporter periplasmic adaptor subunit [Bacteroidia bacterium]MBT8288737.1 efflux RND transporter periplasmic adaptor subunit [Bacteroidia bacterium]NNK73286.1 HlyD family efflux transporter periplasmic adaptor subunit [Flavobacteriaceae bacterium]
MRYTLILLGFLIASCSKDDGKITPKRIDLVESVYTSVTIQPDSLYDAHSVVGGIIEKIFVEEGDSVTTGQALIQIINSAPKLNSENARLSLQLARENYSGGATILSGIEDEILAANLRFKNDSINFFRQKNLWDQNIGSKAEYDTKKLNYELSSNALKLLKSRYDRTKRELETAVRQAENNYRSTLINTTDFTVKSKINGLVYALPKNQGELVTTLEPLAVIGSSTDFVIELLVDEVDIVKIVEGQRVLITLDAYSGEVFEAKISKILPNKDRRNQTFTVEALFEDPPIVLYPGLSGEANIITNIKRDVLTIPKSYLVNSNQVKTVDGLITLELGAENLDTVEVISGLEEGTIIYLPDQ